MSWPLSPIFSVGKKEPAAELLISLLVGEMAGRPEGGAVERSVFPNSAREHHAGSSIRCRLSRLKVSITASPSAGSAVPAGTMACSLNPSASSASLVVAPR